MVTRYPWLLCIYGYAIQHKSITVEKFEKWSAIGPNFLCQLLYKLQSIHQSFAHQRIAYAPFVQSFPVKLLHYTITILSAPPTH